MGDGLKLSKDKRHRSSSSIGSVSRSDRKLDLKESIAEVDDQFALAEARCENLQEKIDLVKGIKKKKKIKKLSMTRLNEAPLPHENMSFITVRTQPKKKAVQARACRLEAPGDSLRHGYVDTAVEEQHRALGQVGGFSDAYYEPQHQKSAQRVNQHPPQNRNRRMRPDGDRIIYGRGVQISGPDPTPVQHDVHDVHEDTSDYDDYDQHQREFYESSKKTAVVRQLTPKHGARRRPVPKDIAVEPAREKWKEKRKNQTRERDERLASPEPRSESTYNNLSLPLKEDEPCERPVVELFNNKKISPPGTRQLSGQERKPKKEMRDAPRRLKWSRHKLSDQRTGPLDDVSVQPVVKKEARHPHKMKFRCRRYELPTMASQMKQAGARYYQGTGAYPNIPFVVSKSTAPSHNIGVNIQQVLNGLKVQQPVTGIPPTIAHHMGLGHISSYMVNNNIAPALSEHNEINAIKLGRRLVRLPSNKYMSYNRALNLYREGDGMVPRFLRAISRPHYFYTSMYNLATTREDQDGATSKGNNAAAQEAKQSLAEYASLYREYEKLEKALREGNYEPEWERRRDEIWHELAEREDRVRKMVQDYKGSDSKLGPLRASASTAEDGCRRPSRYKLGNDQN